MAAIVIIILAGIAATQLADGYLGIRGLLASVSATAYVVHVLVWLAWGFFLNDSISKLKNKVKRHVDLL